MVISSTMAGAAQLAGASIDPTGHAVAWSDGAPDARADRDAGAPSGARILVVEDEHIVGLDLQVRLGRMGHEVVVAHSGEEAVEKAGESHFDLVLMDIRLGGPLDGIEAARTIRHMFDVPVIYVTAYADKHTLDRARYTEPYGYILKPFQDRELRAAIEIALQRHARDRLQAEQQRLQHLLAEASAHMATSLDYRAIVRGIADLVVPRYADWCLIHLRGRDDCVPAYSYAQPARVEAPASHAPIIESVERTARPELVARLHDPASVRDTLGAPYFEVLRELGARSLVCVPLVARGQVIGSIALVAGRLRPRYGAADLAFAEDLAQRLALALDNAMLYAQAERAIRMRDDVLAIVSHDLRAPLQTIVLQAEALIDKPDVCESGRAIARSAERMNRLIGDLVDASAISAGRLALTLGAHRADALVYEAAETFRSAAQTREIELAASASDAMPVRCDRERVLQALSNLIDNALRFTPRKGRVDVSAERRDGSVRFTVRDTGRGISAEALPHLFERFWRVRSRKGGPGLGLFIVKGIVAAHGGTLGVDSTEGVGSTFYFDLPLAG